MTTTTIEQEFAERMTAAREARGLTERELAFEAGTGQSHVLRLAEGEQAPQIDTLYKFAEALEVPVLWLCFGDPDEVPPPEPVAYVGHKRVRDAFHRRAKFAREHAGLTQRELGERLGMDQGNVSAIERGVQGAKLTTLHAYVRALDLPPAWLLGTGAEVRPWHD